MPRIKLSTRTLQTPSLPSLRLPSGFGEGLAASSRAIDAQLGAARSRTRAVGDTIRAVDSALAAAGRIKGLIDRRAERDADEAATQWETAMLNGIEGTVGKDGVPRGGIAQKTWQDYEGTGGSPIRDIGEIEKNFQSSDVYKNLSGAAREKFNRKVMTRRAQYLATANKQYNQQRIARTAFFDAQADLVGERKIETAMLASDDAFEQVAREETFRKMGRRFRGQMANPEVVDAPGAQPCHIKWKTREAEIAYDTAVAADMRKLSIGRVALMAQSAAQGEVKWVDGRLVTGEDALRAAEAYATKLALPTKRPVAPGETSPGPDLPARINAAEAQALGYKIMQARSQLDQRIRKEIADRVALVATKGDLATLEKAEHEFDAAAKSFADGSVGQISAIHARDEIAHKADDRATYEIMDALTEGRHLTFPAPTTYGSTVEVSIYPPGSRKARCYPKAVEKLRELKKRDMAVNDTELRYAEAALDQMAVDGLHSDEEIARAKRLVYEKGNLLYNGRMLTPEDGEAFNKRWKARNTKEESRAAVEFDRAFGVTFEMNHDGTTAKDASTLARQNGGQAPKYPGTGASVNMREYLKMRQAFLDRIRTLDPKSDRVGETKKLISEFKSGWFKNRTAANIEEMTRRMTEINNDASARIENERLRAAEAERIKTLPVMSMERPGNRPPPENPLELYFMAGSKFLHQ